MEITRTSLISNITRTKDLNVTKHQVALYNAGELAQRAFPQLSKADREFIISGITDEEWNNAFAK